jgi:hypothetical protein
LYSVWLLRLSFKLIIEPLQVRDHWHRGIMNVVGIRSLFDLLLVKLECHLLWFNNRRGDSCLCLVVESEVHILHKCGSLLRLVFFVKFPLPFLRCLLN